MLVLSGEMFVYTCIDATTPLHCLLFPKKAQHNSFLLHQYKLSTDFWF